MSNLPAPRYSLWQAVSTALAVASRAIEEVRALAREPGPPGEKGERGNPGRDGFGFDDLSVHYDGERGVTFRFARGEEVKEFSLDLPIVLDRGVWREGAFKKGDGVTWGGSFFIAQEDTSDKPETSKSWRLAVKRGRDGRDGKPGEKGDRGDKGEKGDVGPRAYTG